MADYIMWGIIGWVVIIYGLYKFVRWIINYRRERIK